MTGKICPKYYVENESDWKQLKQEVVDALNKNEELERAVKVLQEKGIISCPEVWINGTYSKSNVRSLIVKSVYYVKWNLQIVITNIYLGK